MEANLEKIAQGEVCVACTVEFTGMHGYIVICPPCIEKAKRSRAFSQDPVLWNYPKAILPIKS